MIEISLETNFIIFENVVKDGSERWSKAKLAASSQNSNKIHRVFVRILKEDATPSEQAFFLRETKPYRDLNHANVLRLLGRCLENVPFLLVFEACSNVSVLDNYSTVITCTYYRSVLVIVKLI
ncbi:receptor protein-tyrosine kinase [Sarracenia purpurea var. burkii]